jgi:hypothetical protein
MAVSVPMDQQLARNHLAQAEQHISLGKQHIARQESIIAELERDGHDVTVAKGLLATLLKTQAAHEEHRRTILAELGLYEPPAEAVN